MPSKSIVVPVKVITIIIINTRQITWTVQMYMVGSTLKFKKAEQLHLINLNAALPITIILSILTPLSSCSAPLSLGPPAVLLPKLHEDQDQLPAKPPRALSSPSRSSPHLLSRQLDATPLAPVCRSQKLRAG